MYVTKCDVCKKQIKHVNKGSATIGFSYKEYAFCKNCNEPVLKILRKHKFIEKLGKKS